MQQGTGRVGWSCQNCPVTRAFISLLQGLVQCFTHTLLLDTAGAVLAMATNWDEIEIQEETESGSSVTSKIRLPVQVRGAARGRSPALWRSSRSTC